MKIYIIVCALCLFIGIIIAYSVTTICKRQQMEVLMALLNYYLIN